MDKCIGIFDSGVGGLSVLRALRERLPGVPLRYLADSAHAPYGGRDAAHIMERSVALTQRLVDDGAALIVVACNTATVQAIAALRERWPTLPFVGVEPGIKPAAAQTRNRRIAVMATAATVGSARVQRLVEQHAGQTEVLLQGCPGVVDVVERADGDSAALLDVLRPYCERVRAFDADTVVLGCTHYPFVEPQIRELLGPAVRIIDTARAIAERAASLWNGAATTGASLTLQTTGDPQALGRMAAQWLRHEGEAARVMV
jgi:glutamate racemase